MVRGCHLSPVAQQRRRRAGTRIWPAHCKGITEARPPELSIGRARSGPARDRVKQPGHARPDPSLARGFPVMLQAVCVSQVPAVMCLVPRETGDAYTLNFKWGKEVGARQ